MTSLQCPSCKTNMDVVKDPDFSHERCPNCQGIFLDKGELNSLATGIANNIEWLSIDNDWHHDVFSSRTCPKCQGTKMNKINFLRLSDLIFDHCPDCGGFFLDKSEAQQMNAALKKLSPHKAAEEYRDYRGDHLIRIDQIADTEVIPIVGVVDLPTNVITLRVQVFFTEPLESGLRLIKEKWAAKLTKVIGLFDEQDVQIGDSTFDGKFLVQGRNEEGVHQVLNDETRNALLEFVKTHPPIISTTQSLEVSPASISYTEGPHVSGKIKDVLEKCEPTIAALLNLASKIEAAKKA